MRRRALRWLGRAALAVAALVALALAAVALVTGTAWGRASVLRAALDAAEAAITGGLDVRALERLSPRGIALRGVRLTDPAGTEVAALEALDAELAPLELLAGRIVIRSLALGPGHVDLRELERDDRGLGAALAPRSPAAPDTAGGEPPHVRIERLTLHGLSVLVPELAPPLGALSVRALNASARVTLGAAPEVELRSLSAELWRGEAALLRLTRASGALAAPGQRSRAELGLELAPELGSGRLELRASAALPASAEAPLPFELELGLSGARAVDLAALLEDPALGAAYLGSLGLRLQLSGTLDDVAMRGTLSTAGGPIELSGSVSERTRGSLEIGVQELELGALRAELPEEPLTLALRASADWTSRERVPLRLAWREARLGSTALPELSASGTWSGATLEGLELALRRGASQLEVRGAAGSDGHFALDLRADVRRDALADLAARVGSPRPPAASLGAELHIARTAADVWRVSGGARARRVAWPGLDVAAARAQVALEGPLLSLRGDAELDVDGLTSSGVAVRGAHLRLTASPREYRLRGEGHAARASAALDLRARRDGAALVVRGQASARVDRLPIALRLAPTRVGLDGSVATEGLSLDVAGAAVQLSGSYASSQVSLDARARGLDLAALGALGVRDWRGRGELLLHAQGHPRAPRLRAALDVRDLARPGAPPLGGTLGVSLDVRERRASLAGSLEGSADASSSRPGAWLGGAFSVAAELPRGERWWERWREAEQRVAVELRALELSELARWLGRPLPVSGRVSLSGLVAGSVRQPTVDATLTARLDAGSGLAPLSIEQRLEYAAGALDARTSVDDGAGRWLETRAELELPPGASADLTALAARAGELPDASRWRVSVDAARRALGSVWAAAPPAVQALEAAASLQLEHAPSREPTGQLTLLAEQRGARVSTAASCAPADVSVELRASLRDGALTLETGATQAGARLLTATAHAPLLLGPALRGAGLVYGSMSGELTTRALDLGSLPLLCERARGRLDVHARAADLLGALPLLELDVSARGLSFGSDTVLDVALRGHADQDDAALDLDLDAGTGRGSLGVAVPIRWLTGRVEVAADAPLRARAALDRLPIAPLLDSAGALSYVSGTVSGNVDVTGTLSAPEPRGHLELNDAELTATALAQPLQDVQGRFSFDRRALVIESFRARDRDGALELSGRVARRDGGALAVALSARAERFPLRQRGQVVATTSGRAKVDATVTPECSTVLVELVDVDTWLEKFQPRTGIDLGPHPDYVMAGASPGEPPEAARAAEAGARPSLVRIDASDRFWIKREDFAIQLSTRLEASIEEETRVKGRVDINRGYISLMGRVFNVERGSSLELTGTSPPDPTVSITARYQSRSSGETVTVQITGRGSKPELRFLVDEREVSAMAALEVLIGRRSSGSESSAKQDATSVVQGLTAGLLATSARRELGAAAPILMIEPGAETGGGRIRAGFELDALVPGLLRDLITGVYVEGIVEREGTSSGQSQQATTQAGVLVELYFPHQLFTTGQWGPGTTWSIDWGWQL